eukprot:TRINITY_DN3435_c0_g1_i2.p1 TRINITY_DN3435_c0_g1~~TRINITY_DN3435_c0_g1_i2.p1  ORF type:complete len:264 (-),score=30.05 TRINITY_DN3435_c0_g1_i2:1437-2228(-)
MMQAALPLPTGLAPRHVKQVLTQTTVAVTVVLAAVVAVQMKYVLRYMSLAGEEDPVDVFVKATVEQGTHQLLRRLGWSGEEFPVFKLLRLLLPQRLLQLFGWCLVAWALPAILVWGAFVLASRFPALAPRLGHTAIWCGQKLSQWLFWWQGPTEFQRGNFRAVDERSCRSLGPKELPTELAGVFLLVGPTPKQLHFGQHWFDGDGMVHACILQPRKAMDGRLDVFFCNDWVNTDRLQIEAEYGLPLFPRASSKFVVRLPKLRH